MLSSGNFIRTRPDKILCRSTHARPPAENVQRAHLLTTWLTTPVWAYHQGSNCGVCRFWDGQHRVGLGEGKQDDGGGKGGISSKRNWQDAAQSALGQEATTWQVPRISRTEPIQGIPVTQRAATEKTRRVIMMMCMHGWWIDGIMDIAIYRDTGTPLLISARALVGEGFALCRQGFAQLVSHCGASALHAWKAGGGFAGYHSVSLMSIWIPSPPTPDDRIFYILSWNRVKSLFFFVFCSCAIQAAGIR